MNPNTANADDIPHNEHDKEKKISPYFVCTLLNTQREG